MHVYIYVCKYNVQKQKQVNNTLNFHTVFILQATQAYVKPVGFFKGNIKDTDILN